MKPALLVLVVGLAVALTACTGSARVAQMQAAERIGAAAATVTIERQPDECGRRWSDLKGRLGEDAQALLKRYIDYVRGPINDRLLNCYLFNENQRLGLTSGASR